MKRRANYLCIYITFVKKIKYDDYYGIMEENITKKNNNNNNLNGIIIVGVVI